MQIVEHPADIVRKSQGSVAFDHVHFGYNPEQIIINDFSAKVKAGTEDCDRWSDRSRKDNDGQTADAFL